MHTYQPAGESSPADGACERVTLPVPGCEYCITHSAIHVHADAIVADHGPEDLANVLTHAVKAWAASKRTAPWNPVLYLIIDVSEEMGHG
jgi:hypothetical protein